MKQSGLTFAVAAGLGFALAANAADATRPVDYTQRNAPFAPAGTVTPEKKELLRADAVQDKRFEKTTVEKKPAAVGDRRAAIDVTEARDKKILEKNTRQPDVREQPKSVHDHQESHISTATDTKRPPHVAKYQDSLVSASASNMARFPADSVGATAKINRFVFRKNAPDTATALGEATVTPAAGPAPVVR